MKKFRIKQKACLIGAILVLISISCTNSKEQSIDRDSLTKEDLVH